MNFFNPTDVALVVSFLEHFPFVEQFFSATQSDLHFGQTLIIDIQNHGNNSESSVFDGLKEFIELASLQQEFSGGLGLMVVMCRMTVFLDGHVDHKQLVVAEFAEAFSDRGLPRAQGFNFRAPQNNASSKAIHNLVVKARFTVFYCNVFGQSHEDKSKKILVKISCGPCIKIGHINGECDRGAAVLTAVNVALWL